MEPAWRRLATWTSLDGLALVAVLLLALAIRVHEATRAPLWFDELFTLGVVQLPAARALDLLRHDMHPPLFYMAVAGWRALGGESELWLRLAPIVAGVATVAATFGLAREAFGPRAGLLAALLLALHRTHVYHSQELRSFAWLWMFETFAAWYALRWVRHRKRNDAVAYLAAASLALWTHYLALVVLAVIGLWGLIAVARTPRRALEWIGINLVSVAMFTPQLPTFLAQLGVNQADHWVPVPDARALLEWWRVMSFGVLYVAPVAAVLGVLAFRRPRSRGAAALIALAILLPVLGSWWLTRHGGRLFTVRYMMYAAPFACALIAGGIASLGPRALRIGVAAALVFMAGRSLALKQRHVEATELARAAAWIQSRLRPGDVVFHAETHTFLFFRHYHAKDARQRLLLSDPALPYYEGALLIPDGERATLGEFDRARSGGGRWFGVRVRHLGMDGDSVAARFQAAAGAPRIEGEVISVWSSTP